MLAERRRVIGYTQERLAEMLGVERSTVVRWEAGETSPQPWCRPKLAKILAVSVDELGILLTSGATATPQEDSQVSGGDVAAELAEDPEHDLVLAAPWSQRGTVEVAVVLGGGDRSVKRRGFVVLSGLALTAPAHQWLIQQPGPLESGLSGRRVSPALADRFVAMIAELRAMDDLAGGGSVLSLAREHFGMITGLLDQASYDEPTGRRLLVCLAEVGQLAGWAAFDAGRQGLAQRYYLAGLRAAHSADDRPLGAHILGSMAHQAAREGHPGEAITLIDTAMTGVRGRATPRLLASLHSHQAYPLATLGDSPGATAAITKARDQIDRATPEGDLPYLYWVGPADVTAWAGRCLLRLGKADHAVALLGEGIALLDESFVRDRQQYLIRHAEALVHPGPRQDLEAALERGGAALDLSGDLDSAQSAELLRDLLSQLGPHVTVPVVREFMDRARELVAV
jgi:transcriptional regulator with XRE-family HTH domain